MADPTQYPWLAQDERTSLGPASVAAQLGAHADWDKFMREARPSTNVEDNRGDVGMMTLLRALGTQGLYQGQSNLEALQAAIHHPFTPYNKMGVMPETTNDPLATAAGYNSLAPDLPLYPPQPIRELK